MFTAAESAEAWDCWQRGEGLKLIGRVFGRTSSAIFQHLKRHGGIRPAARRRSRRALGLGDREEISRGIAAGVSLPSLARFGRGLRQGRGNLLIAIGKYFVQLAGFLTRRGRRREPLLACPTCEIILIGLTNWAGLVSLIEAEKEVIA
jgi:hypothetical protein